MSTIKFITSNKGKINTLKNLLKSEDINAIDLEIIEPQADNVKEVSLIKAKKAFEILKQPVLVEDGGFEIEALCGFPGVYTKYILQTIGIDGILKLLNGIENRKAKFVSCTTYIDEHGNIFQFERDGGNGLIAKEKSVAESKFAWSDIWYIFYVENLGKTLSECSEDEMTKYYSSPDQKSSLIKFTEWYNKKAAK